MKVIDIVLQLKVPVFNQAEKKATLFGRMSCNVIL